MKTVLLIMIHLFSSAALGVTCKPGSEGHGIYLQQQGWSEFELSSSETPLVLKGVVDSENQFHLTDAEQERYPSPVEAQMTLDKSHPDFEGFVRFCQDPDLSKGKLLTVIPTEGNGPFSVSIDFNWAPKMADNILFDWSQFSREDARYRLNIELSDEALVHHEFDVNVNGYQYVKKINIIRDEIVKQLTESNVDGSLHLDISNHMTLACDLLQGRASLQLNGQFSSSSRVLYMSQDQVSQEFVTALYSAFKDADRLFSSEDYKFAAGFFSHRKVLEIDPNEQFFYSDRDSYNVFKRTLDGPSLTSGSVSESQLSCLRDQVESYDPLFVRVIFNMNLTFDKKSIFGQ